MNRFFFTIMLWCVVAAGARAEPYTIFLLDISGSMEYPFMGKKGIDRGKEAVLSALATSNYQEAELLVWNSAKVSQFYGDSVSLRAGLGQIPGPSKSSFLGSALLSISDAGYRCTHVVFVADKYPDDQGNFKQALRKLLEASRHNTLTVYVIEHRETEYIARRFAKEMAGVNYRVTAEQGRPVLGEFLRRHPVTNSCGLSS